MAKMKGIQLKSIKNTTGMEGYGFSASLYLDGKKIGTVADYADGGDFIYDFTSKEAEKAFEDRIKSWYEAHPMDDFLKCYKMSPEEYMKKREAGTLPVRKYEDAYNQDDIFIDELLKLTDAEKAFKKGVKQGYKGYAVYEHPDFEGIPCPKDKAYFMPSLKSAEMQLEEEKEKYAATIMHAYFSEEDFVKE